MDTQEAREVRSAEELTGAREVVLSFVGDMKLDLQAGSATRRERAVAVE